MSSSGTVRELWWEFATRKLLAREAEGYGKLDVVIVWLCSSVTQRLWLGGEI